MEKRYKDAVRLLEYYNLTAAALLVKQQKLVGLLKSLYELVQSKELISDPRRLISKFTGRVK